MADYMPFSDADFDNWQKTYLGGLGPLGTTLGFTAAEIAEFTTQQDAWADVYDAHKEAVVLAQGKRAAKDAGRAAFEAYLRGLVRRVQANPATTDAIRLQLGITARDTEPTPVAAPSTRPVLQLDFHEAQRIIVHFADEGTPTKKAKPKGVHAILLQVCIAAEMPGNDAAWQFLGLDTATPYLMSFDSSQAGLRVWIRACWINTRNEQGPWSAAVSAKIPG